MAKKEKNVNTEISPEQMKEQHRVDHVVQLIKNRYQTTKEEYAELHKAIRQLTPRQQEMVKLVYFEGKTQEEVAKHYGVTKQAISNAMQRIFSSLKKFMEKI